MILAVDFYTQVMQEIVAALGAAMFVAFGFALLRRRADRRRAEALRAARLRARNAGAKVATEEKLPAAPVGRSVAFMLLGLFMFVWGVASFLASG